MISEMGTCPCTASGLSDEELRIRHEARANTLMMEFHGRAILYGERKARAWFDAHVRI